MGPSDALEFARKNNRAVLHTFRADGSPQLSPIAVGVLDETIVVSGPCEIVHLPDALELLVEYYRSLRGEHPDWDEYRAAMVEQQRVMLRITPERVGPTVAG